MQTAFWVVGLLLVVLAAVWWLRSRNQGTERADAWLSSIEDDPDRPGERAAQGAMARAAQKKGKSAKSAGYSPDNVGNDASARPWERNSLSFRLTRPGMSKPALTAAWAETVMADDESEASLDPRSVDRGILMGAARAQFDRFHLAIGQQDWAALRGLTDDSVIDELRQTFGMSRPAPLESAPVVHERVVLDTRVVDLRLLAASSGQPPEWAAAVEFSGMVRNGNTGALTPFREVWTMAQSIAGVAQTPMQVYDAWRVNGVEVLG
jgi:predicted lipid-binding transport protein (Tim44 family)